MVKLMENLYMIAGNKLSHPWDANAYFLPGEEPTLIDCGSHLGYDGLKRNLNQLGYSPKDIRKVVGTHGHWDHVSGMARLREESDAALWLHSADAAQVEEGDFERTAAFLYNEPFMKTSVDRFLEDGEEILAGDYTLTVYHTPGHSLGSVALLSEIQGLKILFTGDTVGGGFHPKVGSDLDAWEKSLDRLLELDFDVYTMGHSHPTLIFDAKTKIHEARQQFNAYLNPWFKPFYLKFQY